MTAVTLNDQVAAPPPRRVRGGGGFLEPSPLERAGFTEFIPLQITRRFGRKIIVAPPDAAGTYVPGEGVGGRKASAGAGEANPLVRKIARGFRYRDMMESGDHPSQSALADKIGITRSYMGRLIRLTLLAPDIIQAIVEGREPGGLSVHTLTHEEFPDEWNEQRKALGFPAVA